MVGVAATLSMFLSAGPPVGGALDLTLAAGDLRILLREDASPVERRAAELLVAEIGRRTGWTPPIGEGHSATYSLCIGTTADDGVTQRLAARRSAARKLGVDGYAVVTKPDAEGRMWVIGQSGNGLVAGVGRLLRLARYAPGAIALPGVDVADTPAMPVRGMYFATHFGNFYHVAPLEEVDRVIEDLALWGCNSLSVWFDMHHFQSFQDPAAQAHIARLRHFGETARGVGMHFGLTFIANEGYGGSPEHLREQGAPGAYGCELCPSIPEGLELIGRGQAEVLDAFSDVDFIWIWPYDQGGCWCDNCRPWGANGFLRAGRQLAQLYRQRQPEGKAWLSTWLLDYFPGASGEYDGLFRYIREFRPTWFDGIIAGTHGAVIPAPLRNRPLAGQYPLTCFPEISMYQMNPWGGCGANPLPAFCTQLGDDMRGKVVGGWPYSEGIYEDLNKVFWIQWFWRPETATDETLAQYASYYLSPSCTEDAVRLFHLLESTHARNGWSVHDLTAAEEAFALAESIDARLPEWARSSWRWRLLYVRAAIDHVLKSQGAMSPEGQAALKLLADEIRRIYHAEGTFIAPAALPRPRDPGNLAFGRPVEVSSANKERPECKRALLDGILSEDDGENFWASDPATDDRRTVTIDLGEVRTLREVRLQFRGIFGVYWFVPTSITIQASDDGESFTDVLTSDSVPKEGAAYSSALWSYAADCRCRFLRLVLGSSQHTMDPYPGVVELTEVEVY